MTSRETQEFTGLRLITEELKKYDKGHMSSLDVCSTKKLIFYHVSVKVIIASHLYVIVVFEAVSLKF